MALIPSRLAFLNLAPMRQGLTLPHHLEAITRTREAQRDPFRIISNAIVRSKGDKRMYIGPEIDSCQDFFALHYRLAFEKVRLGFLE